MQTSSVTEVPASENILQHLAGYIFDRHSQLAPDFSNLYILLPHSQLVAPFNEALSRLLGSGADGDNASTSIPSAIIPPWSGTLKNWAKQFTENQNPNFQIIGEQARQLLFIEALQQYPDLFKEENKWQVTQALLKLFDELTLNQSDFFHSAEQWQDQLQQAYDIEQPHPHLTQESKLVYTLWHAWQTQLDENQLYDDTGDYLSRLQNAKLADGQEQFICLGFVQGLDQDQGFDQDQGHSGYSKTEQAFIQQLIADQRCEVIDYAATMCMAKPGDTETRSHDGPSKQGYFPAFIAATFARGNSDESDISLKQRTKNFAKSHPHFFSDKPPFTSYLASDEESQVRAIDFQVRRKLLDGSSRVAIISEDRKLSRRLRALLERAGIQLQDKAGWSLATTQASTIVERWLECIEEDFNAYPLLDCLKSPFLSIAEDQQAFKTNIYRFEHDLIFYENISSNIEQYKKQLKKRLQRLSHWPEDAYVELTDTLSFIANTAKPLVDLYSAKTVKLSGFLQVLLNSLEQLGVLKNYQGDEAGLVLLSTFEELKQSLKHADPELSWQDCRLWLGMALEAQHFTPPTNNNAVQLMTLEQSAYLNFDSIIIAATEPQHFPGSARNSPFFNQAVRASLGLSTWQQQHQQRHELFNRALLSAPDILLTACAEEKGEEKPVSPWLELLMNFYQLARKYSGEQSGMEASSLAGTEDLYLHQLVQSQAEVSNAIDDHLPEQSAMAKPVLPEGLIPQRISASAYQRIMNCPYQYFAADGLYLKALEELSDELKKANYGERIHLILQCFHNGHDYYGEAFNKAISADNRHQAEQQLEKISDSVFLKDLENNVLHRSWLHRWKKHIPAYISWQIRQQENWDIFLSEELMEVELAKTGSSITIYGRLDRIDKNKNDQSHAIIDYKTGRTARQEDVENGENVQLGIYALLDSKASAVSYLSVDSSYQKVETKSSLSGDELTSNREQNSQRLHELFKLMRDQQAMPAWGDESVCKFCNFSGLCRKGETD